MHNVRGTELPEVTDSALRVVLDFGLKKRSMPPPLLLLLLLRSVFGLVVFGDNELGDTLAREQDA